MKMRFVLLASAIVLIGWVQEAYGFFNPSTGRWLSRDPIGERGGNNLYAFVANDTANFLDSLGLTQSKCCICVLVPSLCYIDVEWDDTERAADTYWLPNLKFPLGPGRFVVRFGATITLRTIGGYNVDSCHLRQDFTWHASFQFKGKTDGDIAEDYSSTKSATWQTYHGWWFWDKPVVDYAFAIRPAFGVPHTMWWQAHVFVEEKPSVETWWGAAGIGFYNNEYNPPWGFTRWRGVEKQLFSVLPGSTL